MNRTTKTLADDMLNSLGCRVTEPRRQVARHIAGKSESFRAESISNELPNIGRATVYRTLKLLADGGILCKAVLPDGSPRYSLDSSWHHHHAICTSCGSIAEFEVPELEQLLRKLAGKVPGQIVGHRFELYVSCLLCFPDQGQGDQPGRLQGRKCA